MKVVFRFTYLLNERLCLVITAQLEQSETCLSADYAQCYSLDSLAFYPSLLLQMHGAKQNEHTLR